MAPRTAKRRRPPVEPRGGPFLRDTLKKSKEKIDISLWSNPYPRGVFAGIMEIIVKVFWGIRDMRPLRRRCPALCP